MDVPFQERPVLTLLLAQGGEFAFVVFQAAAGAKVFSSETASLLIGVVALSMLISPLILIAIDKLWLPRYANCGVEQPDEISEQQVAPIIIAGFGRYGQIVARLLLAQDIPTTVLDHDAEMIDTARRFGYRVFYGDATRLDLLRTAGAATAQIFVIAVDDVEQSLAIVDLAKEHFPKLQLVVRARDATHWNKLKDRDVSLIQRELFESSLQSATSVLELLGYPGVDASRLVQVFKAHNIALLEQMYPHYKDREKLISVAKIGRDQLAEQMAKEREMAGKA
jgi:glutathione-regulated potassium-efflux system ancillary protein KefC